ncbi:MAG: C4-type zinc ribbon domain-containing protein [Anaerolineales bacterium]
MSRVSSLYRLQEIDTTLENSQARIEEIKEILENDAAVVQAKQALAQAEEGLSEARVARNQAEHAVESQREKIKQTEHKLYSGSVTNPKELEELQMESESLKRYLETLEDRLLEAMLAYEEEEILHDSRQADYELVTAERGMEHKNLQQEMDQLKATIEKLSEERQAAEANVDEDDLRRYEKARRKTAGAVVVLLQEGSCTACGLAVARSVLQAVNQGNELVTCDQCGRILYAG